MPLPRLSVGEHNASIVVLGEALVGKTCFVDMFLEGRHFILHDAFTSDSRSRTIAVDDQTWKTWLIDLSSSTIRDPDPNLNMDSFENCLARADGVVLLYDVTSQQSFNHVTNEAYMYAWSCRKREQYVTGRQRFGCVVVGNKTDLASADGAARQVSKEMAEEWAQSQGSRHLEVTSHSREEIQNAIAAVIRSVIKARRRDLRDMAENELVDTAANPRQTAPTKIPLRNRLSRLFKPTKPPSPSNQT
ncbi:hypothetical protein ACN47E_006736 [Coniothyrium glycines]